MRQGHAQCYCRRATPTLKPKTARELASAWLWDLALTPWAADPAKVVSGVKPTSTFASTAWNAVRTVAFTSACALACVPFCSSLRAAAPTWAAGRPACSSLRFAAAAAGGVERLLRPVGPAIQQRSHCCAIGFKMPTFVLSLRQIRQAGIQQPLQEKQCTGTKAFGTGVDILWYGV